MNMIAAQALALTLLGSLAGPALADQCRFTSDRSANFTGAIKRVVISAEAGHLKVTGSARGGVNATGRACASSEGILSRITLESRRELDTVYVTVTIGERMSDMFSFKRYATLDLDVTVPNGAQVNVTDTSGDIELSDVAASSVVDQSGDLLVKNINGNLDISDETGDTRVSGVIGNVQMKDGAGNIDITDVRGNVTITQDGSGDIHVSEVGGDFVVKADSTGTILHDHVRGSVHIPAKP